MQGFESGFRSQNTHGFSHAFTSHVDPEELFRKIFGDFAAGGAASGGGKNPFADFDFGADGAGSEAEGAFATEVTLNLTFTEAARGCLKG